jgi:hypothetical protein
MTYLTITLLLFVISIIFMIFTYFEMKNIDYSDADTEKKCTDMHLTNLKEGDKCGAWDGAQCRRGTVVDGKCVSKGTVLPLLLAGISTISFIAFIVYLVLLIIHRHDVY